MKVLITGGTGFIGSNLALYLAEQGDEITICDNNSRGHLDEHMSKMIQKYNMNYILCDLQKPSEFSKLETDYDEIYHLAAVNGTENFYNHPDIVLRVNILSSLNLLDWVVEKQIKTKLLFSSSSEAYAGTKDKQIPTPESVDLCINDITNPRFSYAVSKIAGESLFLNYERKHNLNIRIVRYHNIYGPRMGYEHVMPQLSIRALKKEDPFKIYGSVATRAFCHVSDAARATTLVMRSKATKSKIVNVGNEKEEIKIKDLAKMIIKLSNYNPNIEIKPEPAGCVMRRCPDTTKLNQLTGFTPKINLEQGLKELYVWYSKNYKETM
tara:strand:+ start:199 stop:1170 length:972 start_codon:yes stop_codon:yes gene_type:complete